MNSTIYLSTTTKFIVPETTEVIAVKESFDHMLSEIDHNSLYGERDKTIRILDVMTKQELMERIYPLNKRNLISEIAKINRALAM